MIKRGTQRPVQLVWERLTFLLNVITRGEIVLYTIFIRPIAARRDGPFKAMTSRARLIMERRGMSGLTNYILVLAYCHFVSRV